jgi:hypothetical protein
MTTDAPCRCYGVTCGECRQTIPVVTNLLTQRRLRELRLWHWQQCLTHRKAAQGARTQSFRDLENTAADEHIRAVQTLNEFFATGDTAERDDARQDV